MKAYCFVPEDRIEEITECGMDLSLGQHYVCKVTSNSQRCFMGRLNPRDYSQQEFVPGMSMVKVDLSQVRAFIGEGTFLECHISDTEKFQMFEDSLIPQGEYRLGTYRNPLCLIVNAVLPEAVEIYDSLMDEAVPYETSQELYLQCLFEEAVDQRKDFRERSLETLFESLVEDGKMKKVFCGNYNTYYYREVPYILRKG